MSLLPPFSIEERDLAQMSEVIAEDLEAQLMDLPHLTHMHFDRIEFKAQGFKGQVFLRPVLPVEFFHCREMMISVLKSYGAKFKADVQNEKNIYLPIGRCSDLTFLETAVDTALMEFQLPLELKMRSIDLFEKKPWNWPVNCQLFRFSHQGETQWTENHFTCD
jgi:hypothetical protein